MANNQFLVSVAEAIGRDPNTGQALFWGKTNISSAFTLSMQKQEVRGGILNPLLYVYYHTRAVEIKIEEATFDKMFLALNTGQLPTDGTFECLQTECVTLVSGVGTTSITPLSDVAVFLQDGSIQNVTPTGKSFTVVSGANQSVNIVYTISTALSLTSIATTTPPNVIDMTLIAQVRDSTGVIVDYLQINIPRFQISGNYTLSLAANGVSQQALEGFALAVNSTDCTTGDYFATVKWVPAASTAVATSAIVAIPSTLVFPISGSTTKNATALAIKGSSTTNITTSASFITNSGSFAVGLHTGSVYVSGSNSAAAKSASMVVSYTDPVSGSTLTDWVNLVVA